jgi:hypothetical protein
MPGKMARSDPRLAFGLPEVLVAVRENANIDASWRFIWRISVDMLHRATCLKTRTFKT